MQVFQFSLAFWEAMMGRWPYRSMCVDYDCFLQIFSSWGWSGRWGPGDRIESWAGWGISIYEKWFVTVLHLSLVDQSCLWEELSSVPNGQIAAPAPSRPPTPGIWWDQLEQSTFLWAAASSTLRAHLAQCPQLEQRPLLLWNRDSVFIHYFTPVSSRSGCDNLDIKHKVEIRCWGINQNREPLRGCWTKIAPDSPHLSWSLWS